MADVRYQDKQLTLLLKYLVKFVPTPIVVDARQNKTFLYLQDMYISYMGDSTCVLEDYRDSIQGGVKLFDKHSCLNETH